MLVWVHVIRFSFFVFKLNKEWPFGYTHSLCIIRTEFFLVHIIAFNHQRSNLYQRPDTTIYSKDLKF